MTYFKDFWSEQAQIEEIVGSPTTTDWREAGIKELPVGLELPEHHEYLKDGQKCKVGDKVYTHEWEPLDVPDERHVNYTYGGVVIRKVWRRLEDKDVIQEGDQTKSPRSSMLWIDMQKGFGINVGEAKLAFESRYRRRITAPVQIKAPKWSCGHGRDPDAKHCPVCSALWYRIITD